MQSETIMSIKIISLWFKRCEKLDDDDNVYEGVEYLFDESIMYYPFKNNGLQYEEIKKLLSVKSKKECIEYIITDGIIKQEEAIDYDVNYYRENYRRCEKLQEIDYIKY